MKKSLITPTLFAATGITALVAVYAARPLYMNHGATLEERSMPLPGDELVPAPKQTHTVGTTIHAAADKIYPWLVQLGAERGGFYSYAWIENLIGCRIVNADRIHPEWQNPGVGDKVKLYSGEAGPPPYRIAALEPNQAMILGHNENGAGWTDTWQFVLLPLDSQTTRLLVRTRTIFTGGIWAAIDPGVSLMEFGMLRGIKARAEV